jgi:hypothetical protein
MSESVARWSGIFAKFWRSLKGQIVSDVPLDIEFCEYGCRKPQCLHDHWEHCDRRLSFIEKTKALATGDK